MVPNGWKQSFLEDIASFSQGTQVDTDKQFTEYSEGMVRFLRITDFVDQGEMPRFIQNPGKKFIVNDTDLSMVRYGSAGAGDLVRGLSGAIANNLFRVIPNELEVTKDYIWVYLGQSKVKHFLFGNSTSSTMPAVSFKLVGKLLIDLPPLPEQQKIANILSTWDKAISTTKRLIDNSTQQKKALMQQLLTGKRRLLDDAGKRFEGEWEDVKLGNICLKVTDGAHHSPQSVEIGYPMYSVKDMTSLGFRKNSARLISKEDFDKLVNQNCKPELNDILIAKDGSILKYCFVVKEKVEGVILSSIALLRPNLKKVFPEFIAQYFSQEYVRFFVGKALTSGSGVPRIVLKDFKGIQITLPSLKEQQKVATVLTNADKEIELLEQQLADLQQEKKALMQVLLTGKKRVVVDGEG